MQSKQQVNNNESELLLQQQQQQQQQQAFDPYAVEFDEDVWYSESQLFEDHLDEILERRPELDDQIWCKLIVMERNRRVGKAYARVPMITINGSHELSFDGFKIALNGFESVESDLKVLECRKRVGKGIRVKMDSCGNILVKRLGNAQAFVKSWPLDKQDLQDDGDDNDINNYNYENNVDNDNQDDDDYDDDDDNDDNSNDSKNKKLFRKRRGNDYSAICDSILDINGKLAADTIYKLFDADKFKRNLERELESAYPNRGRLEKSCFAIIGLVCNARKILDLPFWLIVINKLAIDKLHQHFKYYSLPRNVESNYLALKQQQQQQQQQQRLPATSKLYKQSQSAIAVSRTKIGRRARQANDAKHNSTPDFVSIFNNNNSSSNTSTTGRNNRQTSADLNVDEDPYTLPANASSSDGKSSINNYASCFDSQQLLGNRRQSRDNTRLATASRRAVSSARSPTKLARHSHAVNERLSKAFNGSIYSPGHALVATNVCGLSSAIPPKLPPRDFVRRPQQLQQQRWQQRALFESPNSLTLADERCSNATSAYNDDKDEQIYGVGEMRVKTSKSSGMKQSSNKEDKNSKTDNDTSVAGNSTTTTAAAATTALNNNGKRQTKSKKSKIFETLRAPFELASKTVANNIQQHKNKNSLSTSDAKSKLKTTTTTSSKQFNDELCDQSRKHSTLNTSSSNNNNKFTDYNNHYDYGNVKLLSATSHGKKRTSLTNRNNNIEDEDVNSNYNELEIPTPDYDDDEDDNEVDDDDGDDIADSVYASRSEVRARRSNNISRRRLLTSTANINNDDNDDDIYDYACQQQQKSTATLGNARSSRSRYSRSASVAQTNTKQKHLTSNNYATSALINDDNERSLRSRPATASSLIGGSSGNIYSRTTGARYRSASVQRFQHFHHSQHYAPTTTTTSTHHNTLMHRLPSSPPPPQRKLSGNYSRCLSINDNNNCNDFESPYSTSASQFNATQMSNLRLKSKSSKFTDIHQDCIYASNRQIDDYNCKQASCQYDSGRNSSAIYGNNSSSSSSDYVYMQPQLRKVNSSGYLNSVFRSQLDASENCLLANNSSSKSTNNKSIYSSKHSRLRQANNNNNKSNKLDSIYQTKSQAYNNTKTARNNNTRTIKDTQQATMPHYGNDNDDDDDINNENINVNNHNRVAIDGHFDAISSDESNYSFNGNDLDVYNKIKTSKQKNQQQYNGSKVYAKSTSAKPTTAIRHQQQHLLIGEWENLCNNR